MTSFQTTFDNLVKNFCKEIASTYDLNEQELFSIWKGEKINTIKKFLSSSLKSDPKTSTKSKTDSEPEIKSDSELRSKTDSKSDSKTESKTEKDDPDLEITREKIMLANKDMLSAMCKKKGLKMSGKKEELVQRLIDSLSSSSSSSQPSQPSHLSITATKSKGEESSVIKAVKSTVSDIAIRRNKYGNFEHMQTGLAFNTDKVVYGKQVDGEVLPLTTEDIEQCKKYKFLYKLPENLNVNKSLDDIRIDDVEEEDDEVIDDEDK